MFGLTAHSGRASGICAAFLSAFAIVGLAACDDAPVEATGGDAPAEETAPMTRWLTAMDPTPVPLFLARVATGRGDLRAADPEVARYAELLAETRPHYIETPRMIANRLIQGGDRLDELGVHMPLDQLLRDLESAGAGRRSLGADVHHYLNLRSEGLKHEAALGVLAAHAAGRQP